MDSFDENFSSFAERDLLDFLVSPLETPDLTSSSPEFTQDHDATYSTGDLLRPMIQTFAKGSPPQLGYVQAPIQNAHEQNSASSGSEPNTPSQYYHAQKRKEDFSSKESQREASRKYRARKKAMIEKLQDQVKTLTAEKEAALQEKAKYEEAYQAMNYQNQQLKNSQALEVFKIEKTRAEILHELEEVMKDPKTPDELIMTYVQKLRACCKSLISIGECNWKMLISPTTTHYLQQAGFFENYTISLDNPGDATSLRQYVNRVMEYVPEITSEQKTRMNQTVEEYYSLSLKPLQDEREQICKDIDAFFACSSGEARDITKAVQAIGTLELLRNNLSKESANWQTYVFKALSCLTARQQASLYLKVEIRHRSIMQLKSMWDTLVSVVKKPGVL